MVRLTAYDILGREVSVLVNERKHAGSYDVKFDGSNLASGVYFYQLQAGNFVQTRRFLLLKSPIEGWWIAIRPGILPCVVAAEAFVTLVIDISHDAYYIVLAIPLLTALLTLVSKVAEKPLNGSQIRPDSFTKLIS
jgi:hypothetical protein